jgi:hypothetical protein
MDMMSMVTSLLAAKSGGAQMQVAATIMKSNADAEKFAVQTLLGAGASSLANVGAGRRRQSRYFALNPLLPSFRGARWREPQMCNCASEVWSSDHPGMTEEWIASSQVLLAMTTESAGANTGRHPREAGIVQKY